MQDVPLTKRSGNSAEKASHTTHTMPDQIEIIERNNDILALFQREPLRSVTKAEQVQDLLGQDIVNISVTSVEPLDLLIGQKIVVFGKTYFLNQLPAAQVKGERNFEYELTFEGPQYTLRRASYFNTDVTGFNTSPDFPLTANVELFLDVLINNLNRVFGAGTWVKGEFPMTSIKTISFNESNCLAALQTVCKEFETEFDIVQGSASNTLHIRKAGQILGHTYQYGRGYGLYELKRQTVTESDIVTRLYPFGAQKNLKSNYRNFSQRLKITDPGYVEDAEAIAAFGVIEDVKTWDDIFPRRTGVITAISGATSFQDASMDFDLSATTGSGTTYIMDGSQPKISFKTGNLAGYEFSLIEVGGYIHSTKTFTIIPFKDERGLELPSSEHLAFQLQIGDEYVILDIVLPETYVESAEAELLFKAQQHLEINKSPKVQYSLTVDEMYLANLAGAGSTVNFYGIGDYVHILDTNLNIDKSSRIIGLRRDVLNPYKYQLTIDDTYQVTLIKEIIDKIKQTDTIIKINDLRDPNRARMGWKTTLELLSMIFDTDGYFDGGKIKPESIETMMLVVGAKSQQFILQDVVFQPNFEGQPNVVEVSEGLLIHYALKEEILTWNTQASTHTISDNTARYIYAKVSKSDYDEGHIIFSTDKILPDQDPTFYHFLIGTLHSVMEGVRWISLTYGATAINGRFIKTGRVQSFDGRTYFDLDMGAIGGHIKFLDAQGNYRDLSDIGAATDIFYQVTITEPLETYVNGSAIAWFQSLNPATWPSGEELFHNGDHWYNTVTAGVSKRVAGAWVSITDPDTVKAYLKQYTRLNGDTSIRLFTALPVAPYSDGDLWMSEEGLRRSIADKVYGQSFDPNNWVEPFNFDNTATAIDGGIVTSGTIQLAGDKNAVWAGITGNGTADSSVRFWAGASYLNRNTAPFRVNQAGEVFGRTRIEVEGIDSSEPDGYKGQAGLAGSETENHTGIRIYAGSNWEGKELAPFRVNGNGFAWLERAQLGNIRISSGGLSNQDDDGFHGQASIVLRNDVKNIFSGIGTNMLPATSGITAVARFENNEVDSDIYHKKIALLVSASGGTHPSALNYAIHAGQGISYFSESLTGGRRTTRISLTAGANQAVDPSITEVYICTLANSGNYWMNFITATQEPLRDGKIIYVLNSNDTNNNFGLRNTVRGHETFRIEGGHLAQFMFLDGHWYCAGDYNNNY